MTTTRQMKNQTSQYGGYLIFDVLVEENDKIGYKIKKMKDANCGKESAAGIFFVCLYFEENYKNME